MTELDLNNLDLSELRQLHRDVQKAIDSFEARQKAAALEAVKAAAAAHGVKLADLLDAVPTRKAVAAKYAHPENPELTWTGRGKRPRWIAEALDAGAKLEDFAI